MTIWVNLLKRKLKDYKLLFLMGLFPILLTWIFVNMFTAVTEVDNEVSFSMYIEDIDGGDLGQSLTSYFDNVTNQLDITIANHKDEDIDFIVQVDHTANEIVVENLAGDSMKEVVLHTLLDQFSNQYGLLKVVGAQSVLPMKLEMQVLEGGMKKDITTPIVVTMLVFGILLGGNYGIKQIFYIREAVGIRVLTAPITKHKLYFMEFMVSSVLICAVSLAAAFAYECLFGVRFSQNILLSFAMIFLISMLATLLGMAIGINVKNEDAGENILSLIITFTSILSGGLMPNFELGSITKLSPIKHVADALNEIVTTGQIMNKGSLILTLTLCLALLSVISIIGLRRREQ